MSTKNIRGTGCFIQREQKRQSHCGDEPSVKRRCRYRVVVAVPSQDIHVAGSFSAQRRLLRTNVPGTTTHVSAARRGEARTGCYMRHLSVPGASMHVPHQSRQGTWIPNYLNVLRHTRSRSLSSQSLGSSLSLFCSSGLESLGRASLLLWTSRWLPIRRPRKRMRNSRGTLPVRPEPTPRLLRLTRARS